MYGDRGNKDGLKGLKKYQGYNKQGWHKVV